MGNHSEPRRLGVRWTVGNVSERGFQALALSIAGVQSLFGFDDVQYSVCVNGLPVADARARVGSIANRVEWIDSTDKVPAWLPEYVDAAFAEGVAWKFAPVRVFPDAHELALDNDVILWDVPPAVKAWLSHKRGFLIAEDVAACFGKFSEQCGPAPRNSGIRGVPAGFDLESRLHDLLRHRGELLTSETDEQGLQVAAVSTPDTFVVRNTDVTICSPFHPHVPYLGTCGAHFVGLNARSLGWDLNGRPASEYTAENFDGHLAELRRRVAAIGAGKYVEVTETSGESAAV